MPQITIITGLSALLNRFRGGGFWAEKVPGRPLFYVAPVMAILESFTAGSTFWSVVTVGIGYLIWGLPAWGQWYDFGHLDKYRAPQPWEERLFRIAGDSDGLAFFLRQMLAMPCFIMLAVLSGSWVPLLVGVVLVCMITSVYAMAWFLSDWGWTKQPVMVAELLAGAAWGIAIQLV